MERILAIGDIHGCYGKLASLMEKIKINPEKDLVVFIGDYIDRGDRSREVVDYLIQFKKEVPSTIFLLGNHEHMLLEYLSGNNINPFLFNGGQKTLNSYLGEGRLQSIQDHRKVFPIDHLDFYRALQPFFQFEDYIFVHAGLRRGISLERQDLFDLLWIREEFYYSKYTFGKTIIFGHTPFPEPFVYNNKVGIDTGAVYGNKLTCVELPAMIFYSA